MKAFIAIQSTARDVRRVRRCRRGGRSGFSLLETALMMVICGVGVMAILELLAAGSMSNAAGAEATSGAHLAGNIREIALGLAFRDPDEDPDWLAPATWKWNNKEASVELYDDVKDLDGCTFSPPIDSSKKPLKGYEKWSQEVTVNTIADDHLESIRPNDPRAPAARVTVRVFHNGTLVHTSSWVAMGKKKPKA
jgi:Tfp pilus assembly protein PilV